MLHFIYNLVANFVCLLFGALQIVYNGFTRVLHWFPAAASNKVDEKQ